MAELNQRVDELEGEFKIVKNEIQSVLLDIRERVLSYHDNPFQTVQVKAPGAQKESDDSGTVTVGGSGSGPGAVSSEGARKMEEQSGELKALMDQLERERNALNEQKQAAVAAQEAAKAVQATQSAIPAEAVAGPPPTAQPMQQPMQPPMQQQPIQPPMQLPMQQSMQQPMMQPPMQQPMQMPPMMPAFPPMVMPAAQAGQGTSGTQQHTHTHHGTPGPGPAPSKRYEAPGREEGFVPRGPLASGPGSRPVRVSDDREGRKEDEGRRPSARRMPSGSPRALERWAEERSRDETSSKSERNDAVAEQKIPEVNLMTLVGLVRWVEKSVNEIGKGKVEAIVEIYRTAGYLPSSYNNVIPQIIRLSEEVPIGKPVTMGDSIKVLLQLDSLLGGKFKTESAVLATLFGEDGGYPWTKQ